VRLIIKLLTRIFKKKLHQEDELLAEMDSLYKDCLFRLERIDNKEGHVLNYRPIGTTKRICK